jgi:hypothetical protein
MRRRSTLLTLPGLLILAVLMAALGLTLWRQGGLAFSPGDLSSQNQADVSIIGFKSHAEFEGQCALCHQPLNSMQAELCTACHSSVGEQIALESGLHGKLEDVMRCANCHSDHQGREFDLRLGNLSEFDHSMVEFSLIWHQVDYSMAPIECLACHTSDDQFSVSTPACTVCHAAHDTVFTTTHLAEFGGECVICHDGLDSMARFDHNLSKFPLESSHQEIACVDCHTEGQFQDLPVDCVSCHAEPAVHNGVFTSDCGGCHNPSSWKPALFANQPFEHATFSLDRHAQDFSGHSITCITCHTKGMERVQPLSCIECHTQEDQQFMTQHEAQFGENCLACHDGVDRMHDFDHQNVFQLDGRHGEIECQSCHLEQVYRGTPTECKDCHPEPEIHAGFFGEKCEYCHSTISWYPALLVNHQFPIDHGEQGELECQVCHVVTYSDYSCYECHEHPIDKIQDKHRELDISAVQLAVCTECHIDGLVHEPDDIGE